VDNKKVEEIEVNTPSKKSWKRKRGSEIFFKIKKWNCGKVEGMEKNEETEKSKEEENL